MIHKSADSSSHPDLQKKTITANYGTLASTQLKVGSYSKVENRPISSILFSYSKKKNVYN